MSRYASPRTSAAVNPLDNELSAIIRYMTTTQLPSYGIENQTIYVSTSRQFHIYKNGEWKPLFPLALEVLGPELQTTLEHSIKQIYDESGNYVGFSSHVQITTDSHLEVAADSLRNELKIGVTNITRAKIDPEVISQLDNVVQGISVGEVTAKQNVTFRPADETEVTILANPETDVIYFGIQKIARNKLADDVVADLESALQSISTGTTFVTAPMVKFTSNENEFKMQANQETNEVDFQLVQIPRSKMDPSVLQIVDSALQRITANGETVQGNDIQFASADTSVLINPNPITSTIDFKVQNLNSSHFDSTTKDIVDHAFHTISVLGTDPVASFRGHDLTLAHDSEIDIITDPAQQKLYFTLLNVPRDKLDSLIVQKAESAVKDIRVNNGLSVAGEHLKFNTSQEFTATVDPTSNTINLEINMIPKSKLDPSVTGNADTAIQTMTLMNGQKVYGTNVRLDSNEWVHFEVDPSTNTLKVFGTNKVRVSDVLPSATQFQNGDIVMVTNTTPPTWYSLYQGAWTPILPPWVQREQSAVQLSSFGGQLDISRVSNYIQADFLQSDPSSNAFIKNMPSWIQTAQSDIQLELFGGDLSWDRIKEKPDSFIAYKLKIATGSFPQPAEQGNVCFRTDLGKAYIFDGSRWGTIENTVATRVTTLDGSFPPDPVQGQVVFRIDQGVTYVYDGMEWDPLGEGFAWIRESQNEILLTDFGGNLAWSRIVPETVPAHFSAFKVRSGSTLPDPSTITKGEVWYRTDINALYIHNGTEWVRQNEYVSWIKSSQDEVQLSAFGGNLDYSRIINTPNLSVYTPTSQLVSFIQTNQTQFALENFASNLPWTRVSGKPAWVAMDQVNVPLELFGGDLDHNRLKNVPVPNWEQADTTQKNFIANKPTWIKSIQSNVSLDAFSGTLDYARVSNKPVWFDNTQANVLVESFGGTFPYSRISNRPLNLTDLVNNTNFLRTVNVLTDSTLQATRDDETHKVTLAIKDVPWSKLSSVPLHFSADTLRSGPTLPIVDVSIGDVFYKTDSQEMFVHNGSSWIKMAVHVDWVNATQSNVDLNAFGGTLPNSRITDQIRVSATAPVSNLYDGLIWRNTTDKTILVYYQGTWFTTGTDWLRPLQSDVKVGGFQNDAGYVDPSGARTAVKEGVLVTDLSGNFPFSRISERPGPIVDLVDGNKFLRTENVGSDSTITVTKDLSNSTVTLAVNTIDWNQVNNKPSTYMTQKVQTVPTLLDYTGTPTVGTLVYELSSKHLYVHTGTMWVQIEELKNWVKEQQSDVQVSSFGGDFPASRISGSVVAGTNPPATPFDGLLWWKDTEEAMYVHYEGIWFPIGSEWALGNQGNVLLSQFNNDAEFVNALGARNAVIDLVDINDLKGNLPYSEITGRPLQLTDLSNNTDFLQISKLSVDSTLQMTTDNLNKMVNLAVKDVPWTKVSGVPSLFTANQIRSAASFPTSPVSGEVIYRTDEKKLYLFSGDSTGWVALNNEVQWVKSDQTDVQLANFGGSITNSRITEQVVVQSTEPLTPYLGMIWTHPTTKLTKLFASNGWITISAPWVADAQTNVDLSFFNNTNSQFINTTQAIQAVKTQVLSADLSGDFPYTRISERPVRLTDLSDNTGFLDPSAITTSDSLVQLTRGPKSLQVNLANTIPWSRIDASSIPVFFDTDRVRQGASLPTTNLDAGDIFYHTVDKALYVHDGSAWKRAANYASWMRETQAEISLNAWGGNLPNSRVSDQFVASSSQPVPPSDVNLKSLSLNGSDQYGTATSELSLYNNYTWSMWIKANTIASNQTILSYYATSTHLIEWFINTSGRLSTINQGSTTIVSSAIVADGNWHHIVLTRSATNFMTMYIDGVADGSGQFVSMNPTPDILHIGQRFSNTTRFAGLMDDIACFHTTFTLQQITELRNNGDPFNILSHSAASTLQVWWTFEDSYISGSSVLDRSGKARNLTLFGNPTTSIDIRPLTNVVVVSKGMAWLNTVNDTMYVYTGTQWLPVLPSWAAKKTQGEVNLVQFDNSTTQFVNNSQVLSSVRTNVKLQELEGTVPYTSLTGAPTIVSAFTNDANYLSPTKIDVSGTQLKITKGTQSVVLELEDIPWTRVVNKPTHFSSDRVKMGSALPQASGEIGEGYLFYHTTEDIVYFHNGTSWNPLGNKIDWLSETQSSVQLVNFGGQLPGSRLSGMLVESSVVPTSPYPGMFWRNTTDGNLRVFNGTEFVQVEAKWIRSAQSAINVSGFTNDASYASIPQVQTMISQITFDDVLGTLQYTDILGRPTQLTDLSNNTTFLDIPKLLVGDSLSKDVSGTTVTLQVSRVPWSKVDNLPTTTSGAGFAADRVLTGTEPPSTGVAGDIFYDTNDRQLFVHSGDASNGWIPIGRRFTWLTDAQSGVSLSNFGGQLQAFRIDDKIRVESTEPTQGRHAGLIWRNPTTNVVKVWDGTLWQLLYSPWVTETQGSVSISGFSNDAQYVRDSELKANVLSKVSITDLSGTLLFTNLGNRPTTLAEFTNTPGFIKYTDIRKQDGDNTLTLTTDHENKIIKLAVNVPSLAIPWTQVTGAPTFLLDDIFQRKFRLGDSASRPTANVSLGDFYYDASQQLLYIHNGNIWVPQSIPDTSIFALKAEIPSTETFLPYTRLRVGAGYPSSNVSTGDMFYDTVTKALSVYDGTAWIEKIPDLSTYITQSELNAAVSSALPTIAADFVTKIDASNLYLRNSAFESTMLLYTKTTDLDANFLKISNFNTIISGYTPTSVLTSTYSTSIAVTSQINNSISTAIAPYLKIADADTTYLKISNFNNTIALYTPTSVLTANYPTMTAVTTQIQSALTNYVSKSYVDSTFATIPNVLTELNLRFSEYTKSNVIANTYVRLDEYQAEFNSLQQDIVLRTQLMPTIQSNQNTLFLNSFGGNLDFTRIANLPSWLKFNSSDIDLNMFGGILDYSRIANAPTLTDVQSNWAQTNPNSSGFIANKPSWITPLQSSIDVALFGGKIDFMRLSNVPSWIRSSQSSIDISGFSGSIDYYQLTNRPSWLRPSQGQVSLSGFKTDLRLSRTYISANPDVTQVGEITLNLEDNELYYHNGSQWKKASSIVSSGSGSSNTGTGSSATMDIVSSILLATGKVTGDLVFDNSTKSAYFHNGTQFVRFGDIFRSSSLQVDPSLVGSMVYNTADQKLYFYKNNAWVEVPTGSQTTADFKIPLVAPSSPVNGDMYFEVSSRQLYVYSNSQWYSHNVGSLPSWVKTNSSEIALSSFYNDLPKTVRVVSTVSGLAGTSGDFVYVPLQNALYVHSGTQWTRVNSDLPSWIESDASQIPLSSFQNDLPIMQIPSWIQNVQDPKDLSLSMFTNDLSSTSEGGEFVSSSMTIYFASNNSTSIHLKGTCSFDGSLEENLFTSYKIILVNPSRTKGALLNTILVGEPPLEVLGRQGIYIDIPFYVHGDMVNPLFASIVTDESSFEGFSLYCLTSKSAVLPTNYTNFANRVVLDTNTLVTSSIDLSDVDIDTYGKILSAMPKMTMDGLVLSNITVRYYERKSLIGFEKVIALSEDGIEWNVGSSVEQQDGSVLTIPFVNLGNSTLWCIGYRVAGQLYVATESYRNRITFIPNTLEARVFASNAYLSQQESLPLKTGLVMDETTIQHHDTTGTMITFSGIKSWENTPYYDASITGYKRLLKQDTIEGRLLGSMVYQNGSYLTDDSYHLYPALFTGLYDSIITDPQDAYIYELKNDTNAPWVASNPSTAVANFGHDQDQLLFRLFKMTYAFIKYGYSTMTDAFMETELYYWYIDNIVENAERLLNSGTMFYSNDVHSLSFHPSIFQRSNPWISSDALDTLYFSLQSSQ